MTLTTDGNVGQIRRPCVTRAGGGDVRRRKLKTGTCTLARTVPLLRGLHCACTQHSVARRPAYPPVHHHAAPTSSNGVQTRGSSFVRRRCEAAWLCVPPPRTYAHARCSSSGCSHCERALAAVRTTTTYTDARECASWRTCLESPISINCSNTASLAIDYSFLGGKQLDAPRYVPVSNTYLEYLDTGASIGQLHCTPAGASLLDVSSIIAAGTEQTTAPQP